MQRIYMLLGKILPYFLMVLASVAIIYIAKDKTSALDFRDIHQSIINNLWLAVPAFLLFIPNWLIETLKWKSVLQKYVAINFPQALKSILAGIGLSIVTPNRIGDLGGRVLYVAQKDRWLAFYVSFLSSSSQLLATILIGSLGVMYFFGPIFSIGPNYFLPILLLVLLIDVGLILLFLRIEKFRKLHLALLPWLKEKINQLPIVPKSQKLQLLLWSIVRYQFFALQFHILMLLLGSDLAFLDIYFALSLIFLCTSFLPTSIISELPVRGSVAYYVFFYLGMDAEPALLSFMLMWLVNLLLPSLFSLMLLKELRMPFSNKFKLA